MWILMRQPVTARDIERGRQALRRIGTPRLECLDVFQVRQRMHDWRIDFMKGTRTRASSPIQAPGKDDRFMDWRARTDATTGCHVRPRNPMRLARISCRCRSVPALRRSDRGSERTIEA